MVDGETGNDKFAGIIYSKLNYISILYSQMQYKLVIQFRVPSPSCCLVATGVHPKAAKICFAPEAEGCSSHHQDMWGRETRVLHRKCSIYDAML